MRDEKNNIVMKEYHNRVGRLCRVVNLPAFAAFGRGYSGFIREYECLLRDPRREAKRREQLLKGFIARLEEVSLKLPLPWFAELERLFEHLCKRTFPEYEERAGKKTSGDLAQLLEHFERFRELLPEHYAEAALTELEQYLSNAQGIGPVPPGSHERATGKDEPTAQADDDSEAKTKEQDTEHPPGLVEVCYHSRQETSNQVTLLEWMLINQDTIVQDVRKYFYRAYKRIDKVCTYRRDEGTEVLFPPAARVKKELLDRIRPLWIDLDPHLALLRFFFDCTWGELLGDTRHEFILAYYNSKVCCFGDAFEPMWEKGCPQGLPEEALHRIWGGYL